MRTTEVRKKKYSLTQDEITAIREVIEILDTLEKDDEISEAIQCEACESVEDFKEILLAILRLDGQDLDC